jgi:DNA-binding response OmpR family regulator
MKVDEERWVMTTQDVARRVLVVEDEQLLADLVGDYLRREGFSVEQVGDGAAALERAREFRPDVVVLDLGLPVLDGVEVCRELRRFTDCYVIMLTARRDEVDKLVGLAVGADDYLTKPFSQRELVARVKAMLRRPRTDDGPEPGTLAVGALTIDTRGREVLLDGAAVPLTATEFDLLATLASNPGLVMSRGQLIKAVWGEPWVGDERMVDVHIRNLRRKLGDDADAPRFVRTVRGAGYRIGSGA